MGSLAIPSEAFSSGNYLSSTPITAMASDNFPDKTNNSKEYVNWSNRTDLVEIYSTFIEFPR
jgi:hypothetical protein